MSDNGNQDAVHTNERGELVLSIEALRPKSRWLDLGGGQMVRIPGGLSLDTMLEIQALEGELKSAGATEATAKAALAAFTDLLTRIINDANPDLPDDFRLELGIQEASYLLVFIAQPNDSVAAAFAEAITAGGAEKPDGASDDARALARAAGLETEEGKKPAPLRSGKRSSSRSSRSARSTTGRQSGGSGQAARSKRSGSTSASRSGGKPSAKANG